MHALSRPAGGLQRPGCARGAPSLAPRLRPQRAAARRQTITSAGTLSETFDAQVCVVLGTQWGDEGKGKLVDILAQQYDVVARAQVGAPPTSSRRPAQRAAAVASAAASCSDGAGPAAEPGSVAPGCPTWRRLAPRGAG
jgi:hypothetical protein